MVELNENTIENNCAQQLISLNAMKPATMDKPTQQQTPPPSEFSPSPPIAKSLHPNPEEKKKTCTMNTLVTKGANGQRQLTGRWTKDEHDLFLKGLDLYGRDWRKIAKTIKTRNFIQIRTHAQKYFKKLAKICQLQGEEVPEELTSTASDGKTWELDRKLRIKAAQVEASNLRLPSTTGIRPGRPSKKAKMLKEEQRKQMYMQFHGKQPVNVIMQPQMQGFYPQTMNNLYYSGAPTTQPMYTQVYNTNAATSNAPVMPVYGQPQYIVGMPNVATPQAANPQQFYGSQYVVLAPQPQQVLPIQHIQT